MENKVIAFKKLLKISADSLFDVEERQKEDGVTEYSFAEAYLYFPKRKTRSRDVVQSASSKDNESFHYDSLAIFSLDILVYFLGLGFIVDIVQSVFRVLLELPFLMIEKMLSHQLEKENNKNYLLKAGIFLVSLPRLFFRCILAPVESLKSIKYISAPPGVKAVLYLLSFSMSLLAYSAIAALLFGVPLAPLFSGKIGAVASNLWLHVADAFSFKLAHVVHRYVGSMLLPKIILGLQVLSAFFLGIRKIYTIVGHSDLRDNEYKKTFFEKVEDFFIAKKKSKDDDVRGPAPPQAAIASDSAVRADVPLAQPHLSEAHRPPAVKPKKQGKGLKLFQVIKQKHFNKEKRASNAMKQDRSARAHHY